MKLNTRSVVVGVLALASIIAAAVVMQPANIPSASAQAVGATSLQAQIASLMAQIAALQAQLGLAPSGGGTFNRDLTLGSQGEDVRRLQVYLNTKGFPVASTGPGSRGSETTTFGALTRAALARFQAANSIFPAVGYFGPKTRAAVNAANVPIIIPPVIVPPVVPPASCTQNTCTDDGKLQRCVQNYTETPVSCSSGKTCRSGECRSPQGSGSGNPSESIPTTATLTASPNPCTVASGQSTCNTTLSWTSEGAGTYTHVQLWTAEVNVSCSLIGQSGTIDRTVALNQPKTFQLYPATSCLQSDADTNRELANITISAGSATTGTPDAAFVSVNTPELMVTGRPYPVSVTMRNTGTMDWVGNRVSLDALGIDSTAWTPARVFLPAGVTVQPGQEYTFAFTVTAQPGKSMRLFSWMLRSVDLQRYFGQRTPTTQGNHTWVVTDTPYTGPTPVTRPHVNLWEYIVGDPITKMCQNVNGTLCQTFYPQGANKVLVVTQTANDGTLIVKYARNAALNAIGVLKDGTDSFLRCLTQTPGSCDNGPMPAMPLVANLPVLPASAINRHLITEEGLDVQMKQTYWWNPINRDTCQPTRTAGSITGSNSVFLLDSYDFGGDVGVQHDVLVLEHVAGYPTDAPLAQLNPWGTKRMERYLFVKGKGFYQSDGIEDPNCRDASSVQTCDGVFSRFTAFGPWTYPWIRPTPVPIVDYCPNI